ncbi:MAG TPA: hypothetical protein VHU87_14690 [Rhizomicrobium sp.]|jgi:hypothetical protein|nr:hypothetical protein [Rhizomicrobium sp.]
MAERYTSGIAKLILVFFFSLLGSEPALTHTVAEAAALWGLVGRWQTDCSIPGTRDNPPEVFTVRDGHLFFSTNSRDVNPSPVLSGAITADHALSLVTDFRTMNLAERPLVQEVRQELYLKDGNGRIRVFQNKNVNNNRSYVIDGVVRDKLSEFNGKPTPWMTRCD